MIIRTCFTCSTCGQPHVVRIGMGQEDFQSHRFRCVECGEEMVVGLHVDFENINCRPEALENAELALEVADAPVVNVHANFVIPGEHRHSDFAFPHLPQMQAMAEVAEEAGSFVYASEIPQDGIDARPYRRLDISGEWKYLKKAWSLYRNGREKLSNRKIKEASEQFYASDPINDLGDWIWRFLLILGNPHYEYKFSALIFEIQNHMNRDYFIEFMNYYQDKLLKARSERYFSVFRSYFSNFPEFSQVYFHVAKGLNVPDGNVASSINFDSTRKLYGDFFECFSSSVDILAFINNMAMGRKYDQFEQMTLDDYYDLAKASRFSPFIMNKPFAGICEEKDNQLRNALYHNTYQFDVDTQRIHYETGKGSTRQKKSIAYATYLARCTKLFLQMATLFRAEIMMCHQGNRPLPI